MTPPRPGHDPTRRNRNIGTAVAGHGRDGPLGIPQQIGRTGIPWWWSRVPNPVWVEGRLDGRTVTIAVQPATPGWAYAITPNEVAAVLALLPGEDWAGIGLVVLRQPTRTQDRLESVWGRLIFSGEIGHYRGPYIVLEATSEPLSWVCRHPGPMLAAELGRLEKDGHRIETTRRGVRVTSNPTAARTTQLFDTLLHEIGHWVDLVRMTDTYGEDKGWDDYHRRPHREREDFAIGYAAKIGAALRASGAIPFDRIDDDAALRRDGLDPAWFHHWGQNDSTPNGGCAD